jgi:hypothetical protein
MNDNPAALYKYLSAQRAIEVLENLTIRFSQFSSLNDARELLPPLRGFISPKLSDQFFLEEFNSLSLRLQRLREEQKHLTSPSEIDARERMISATERELRSFPYLALQFKEQFCETPTLGIEALDRSCGVLCLSETPAEADPEGPALISYTASQHGFHFTFYSFRASAAHMLSPD